MEIFLKIPKGRREALEIFFEFFLQHFIGRVHSNQNSPKLVSSSSSPHQNISSDVQQENCHHHHSHTNKQANRMNKSLNGLLDIVNSIKTDSKSNVNRSLPIPVDIQCLANWKNVKIAWWKYNFIRKIRREWNFKKEIYGEKYYVRKIK